MIYFMGSCILVLLIYALALNQKIQALKKECSKAVKEFERMEKVNLGMLSAYWRHDDQLSVRDYEIAQLKRQLMEEKSKNAKMLHGGFLHGGFSRQVKTRAHDNNTNNTPVTTSNDGLVFVGGIALLDQCSSDDGYDCNDSTPNCTSECSSDIAES